MKSLNHWFHKGLTAQEYLDDMETNRDGLLSILKNYQLPVDDRRFYEQFSGQHLKAIVLTADWCGDAMLNVPILMKIAEAASIDMRYLKRDENLELMDQYLTNGKSRAIPIFIFIDEQGNEKAVWGPRAPEIQQLIDDLRNELPPKDSADFEKKQKEMYHDFKQRLLVDDTLWAAVNDNVKACFEKMLNA